jgi:predicted nucleic acid-binding protein
LASSAKYATDSSVAVAAIDEAAESHDLALAKVRELRPVLAGHAALETYSVLTRLPGSRRLSADEAEAAIAADFPGSCWPAPESQSGFVARLARLGIVGGAIYDALVAQAALDAKRTLLTLDGRARRTYDAIGVRYDMIV